MNWQLNDREITASYLDTPIRGRVLESRVKLGGRVVHMTVLSEDVNLTTDDGYTVFRECVVGDVLTVLDNEVLTVDGEEYTPLIKR